MSTDWATQQKLVDPYNFVKAEEFFQNLDQTASDGEHASSVSNFLFNRDDKLSLRQLILYFDNGKILALRFIRPQVWRLRCELDSEDLAISADHNTKNVVQPTISRLVEVLDAHERVDWDVQLVEDDDFLILQSLVSKIGEPPKVVTQLWIQRYPFQISAVQPLEVTPRWNRMPRLSLPANDERVRLPETLGSRASVVWQTKECGLRYQGTATVLTLEKPDLARYLGWGEQAGTSLFKDRVMTNYFNYDNMEYKAVYGQGPLDTREPLYHSEPFWIETNRNPGYQSKVATFVDNYSQVCVDLGKTDKNEIRIATRFNPANYYFFAGENISDIIREYTAIVGRSWLKPRYALGYGQGAYGYDTQKKVEETIERYRKEKFPLDTMHIDVDFQESYQTFTVDTKENRFPDPKTMFYALRVRGVKCCTNITPFINCGGPKPYKTLDEMIENQYYVTDERYLKGAPASYQDQRYLSYENGKVIISDPNVDRSGFKDDYVFREFFNKGAFPDRKPYRGGVNYGNERGGPGYYPDLNRSIVREWWGDQYKHLIELGLEFVWQDMTSPSIAKEYGDMKSFPCRLLVSSGDNPDAKKPAIEIWSLYAYNLHKATFQGWNRLEARKGKRNFIIGRGSFAGMHRFAGLWTGDNAGTWDFLSISITQALALGLSGLVITGGDVGGFMSSKPGEKYTDPELLIRWYSACFLLPWFRNHYNGKSGQKLFQEPYQYAGYYRKHAEEIGEDQKYIFDAVLPVTRYFTRLRYCLMQMLYDALFENLFTGLPIVKPLIVTEILDESLYLENECFLSTEYIVRKDILVAPLTTKDDSSKGWRTVYLPGPDSWFGFNLSASLDEGLLGYKLGPKRRGGSRFKLEARIQTGSDSLDLSSITPMFIREGAIIPKIQPHDYVPDRTAKDDGTSPESTALPITFHVYPGKDNSYDMYLDDGVSRESAPKSSFASTDLSTYSGDTALVADKEAKGHYRHVRITQKTLPVADEKKQGVRTVKTQTLYDGYGHANVERDIGPWYRVVLWQEKAEAAEAKVDVTGTKVYEVTRDKNLGAVVVKISIEADDANMGICIEQFL